MLHPYSIEDPRQPDDPTPAEEAFDIACQDFTLEAFAALFDEDEAFREAVMEAAHDCAIAGDNNQANARAACVGLWRVCEDAIRRDVESGIESDRLADAADDYYARMA